MTREELLLLHLQSNRESFTQIHLQCVKRLSSDRKEEGKDECISRVWTARFCFFVDTFTKGVKITRKECKERCVECCLSQRDPGHGLGITR